MLGVKYAIVRRKWELNQISFRPETDFLLPNLESDFVCPRKLGMVFGIE